MFSTALKDLAVELDIFMMSSTQLNAKGDDNSNIRNEASLAGSRSIVNKADIACIVARPTKEELQIFIGMTEQDPNFTMPNIVADIYKVRSGQWNQVRIWSYIDLGNLRKTDLFVTDSRMEIIPFGADYQYVEEWDSETYEHLQQQLSQLNLLR